jgi:hypothetical protein
VEYKISFLEDRIIDVVLAGTPTVEEQDRFMAEMITHADRFRAQKLPVYALVNMEKLQFPEPSVRKRAAQMLRDRKFDKIAAFTSNRLTRFIASLISLAAGQKDKFKVFADRNSALDWLKG